MTPTTTTSIFLLQAYLLLSPTGALNVFGSPSLASRQKNSSKANLPPQTQETLPTPPSNKNIALRFPQVPNVPNEINPFTPNAWNSVTSTALALASKWAPKSVRQTDDQEARITVNRLPPDSFQIDLTDVPIVGQALRGTYAKVKNLKRPPAAIISSPQDKWGALQKVNDQGILEFGLGGIFQSTLDAPLEPNQAGVAPMQVSQITAHPKMAVWSEKVGTEQSTKHWKWRSILF